MFDPQITFDPKLAAECGYVSDGFYPKPECDEQELKYLISGHPASICPKIPNHIHIQDNRVVDFRAWSQNPYALITLNLDTEDQKLAKAGFSLRVRFSMVSGRPDDISQIDMCIKTKIPSGTNIVPLRHCRGEWEVQLDNLKPDMDKMIAENARSNPPLPAFFQTDEMRDADFFIKTIGGTLRSVYPSYEGFNHKGRRLVSVFQHTEDIQNIFMTPYADIITGSDTEVEAEFLGLKGVKPGEITQESFNTLMTKAMSLLDRTIVKADPANIHPNFSSKATRSLHALETVYGPPVEPFDTLKKKFDLEARRYEAAHFALQQRIRPEEVNLDNIWHYMQPEMAKFQRDQAPYLKFLNGPKIMCV